MKQRTIEHCHRPAGSASQQAHGAEDDMMNDPQTSLASRASLVGRKARVDTALGREGGS
jgi:hypothetical protein